MFANAYDDSDAPEDECVFQSGGIYIDFAYTCLFRSTPMDVDDPQDDDPQAQPQGVVVPHG